MYHITDHAIERFMERFDCGLTDRQKVRRLLCAMANNGHEHMIGKNGFNAKCLVSKERRTGKRVFLMAEPNKEPDTWYVVKTVLTQPQACATYGFTYPKED